MTPFYKKSGHTDRHSGNTRADFVAMLIFSRIIKLQLLWASYMGRTIAGLPRHVQIIVFVVFGSTCSIVSGYHIATNLHHFPKASPLLQHAGKDDVHVVQYHEERTAILPADLSRVENFVRCMDSLARSPGGKRSYDSIMRFRPGLLDSARHALNLYQSL